MIKRYTIWLISLFITSAVSAQEDDFSQFMLSSIYINPAYASAYTDFSVNMNYKLQETTAIDIQTSQVSIVFPIKVDNVTDNVAGVGLMAFNQNSDAGIYSDNGVFLTYAQNFNLGLLGSDLIAVGIQAGFSRSTTSLSQFNWGSQYSRYIEDGLNNFSPAPVTEFDNSNNQITINAGIMYYYNRKRNYLLHNYSAFSGLAVSNINRPNDSFSMNGTDKEPIKIKYHGGVEVRTGNLYILPNMLLHYSRRQFTAIGGLHLALSFTSSARFTSANNGVQLLLGSWYRLRESYTFMGGVQVNSLAIRGSFDMNSSLFVANEAIPVTPAYEISLTYTLGGSGSMRKVNNALF